MAEQNYSNHAKLVPAYHFIFSGLLFLTLVGSLYNLYRSLGDHERLYNASLIVVLTVAVYGTFFFARLFPLKAQDRAIRAEENLRHYVLTGKLLDARLTLRQIIALRFASDAEFPVLALRAASEGLDPKSIKQAVQSWRADHDRL